jgi:tRNA pseudouridine55 synthase
MRGVLNINKPSGITSYDVIRRLKPLVAPAQSAVGSRKSSVPLGHAGTLDPLASGVLLVLVGDATKASRFLLGQPKEYEADVLLGVRTDTDDITGRTVAESPVPAVSPEELDSVLLRFVGTIQQVPPAFSAIKQDGRPLYDRARRGEAVQPRPRAVTIYELEQLGLWPPRLRLRARVSAGTYIRALARDIGAALGTEATLAGLVRTRSGCFTVEDALPLDSLEVTTIQDRLVPIERALGLKVIRVGDADADRLLQGRAVPAAGEVLADDFALARNDSGSFLAVVRPGPELRTERVIHAS